jgi:hypothetical protein
MFSLQLAAQMEANKPPPQSCPARLFDTLAAGTPLV